MNNSMIKAMVLSIALVSTAAFAKPDFESTEYLRVSVNSDILKCQVDEVSAHSGSIQLPTGYYENSEIVDTKFEHSEFSGSAYLPGDFSCGPIQDIIDSADEDGTVEVKKHVEVYTLIYQNVKNDTKIYYNLFV